MPRLSQPAASAPGAAGAADMPPMPAQKLYNTARRISQGGKYDLAVQEFADYLKYYGNTDLAPNAQFYIAMIHFVPEELRNRGQGIRHGAGEVPGQQ